MFTLGREKAGRLFGCTQARVRLSHRATDSLSGALRHGTFERRSIEINFEA